MGYVVIGCLWATLVVGFPIFSPAVVCELYTIPFLH
jgi:hypothetical protein